MAEEVKETPKKKFNIAKKWWFWVAIAAHVTLVIVLIVSILDSYKIHIDQKNYQTKQYVTVNDLTFVISKVEDKKTVGGEYVNQTTENNYAVVTFVIKNNSTSEEYIQEDNFRYYRGEYEYKASSDGLYIENNGFYLIEKIGAGFTKTLNVVYEIPSKHLSTDYILVKDDNRAAKVYLK